MIYLALGMSIPFLLLVAAIVIHYFRLTARRRKQGNRPNFGMYSYKTTYVRWDGTEVDPAKITVAVKPATLDGLSPQFMNWLINGDGCSEPDYKEVSPFSTDTGKAVERELIEAIQEDNRRNYPNVGRE